MTALMYAACFGYQPIVKLLLAELVKYKKIKKERSLAAQLAEDICTMLDILNGRDIVHNNQRYRKYWYKWFTLHDSSWFLSLACCSSYD